MDGVGERAHRSIFLLLVLIGTLLLAYAFARAYTLSFTHDESISYAIVAEHSTAKSTANHHPLNTRLMTWSYRSFGSREWALRLPNIVAFFLYLGFGLWLLRELAWPWMVFGFVLLFLNPFLLEFFSLARGYGLALSLSLGAVVFLRAAWRCSGVLRVMTLLLLSSLCASLADLGNYVWLNVHLPLLAVSLVVLTLRTARFRIPAALFLLGANGWFIHNLVRRIWSLKDAGELYFGGHDGFVKDTVGSLIESSLYGYAYGFDLPPIILDAIVAGLIVAVLSLAYVAWRERRLSFSLLLLLVLAQAVAISVLERQILGVLYPIHRTALYYVPLLALFLAYAFNESAPYLARTERMAGQGIVCLMVLAIGVHFVRTANLRYTFSWRYDAETRQVKSEIEKRFTDTRAGGQINLGTNWQLWDAMNYYRTTLHYDWLNIPDRDGLNAAINNVIYCFPSDLKDDLTAYTVLHAYPESGTLLLLH